MEFIFFSFIMCICIYYKYRSGASPKMSSVEYFLDLRLLLRPEHIKLIQYMIIQTNTKPSKFLLIKQAELLKALIHLYFHYYIKRVLYYITPVIERPTTTEFVFIYCMCFIFRKVYLSWMSFLCQQQSLYIYIYCFWKFMT